MILAKNSGAKPYLDHDFDGLRLIMHNFDRQFVDVPVVSVQSDLPDERDWVLMARENEAFKAYSCCFVIKDMADAAPGPTIADSADDNAVDSRADLVSKLTFMYIYVMNFRSKYTRELRTNLRRRVISSEEHELGNSHISSIGYALKDAKAAIDRK